ncbi:acylneuraminate cytidylyltransferase family protein [Brevibacillus borstelensis]|jgi:CMP-N,N'-diacetyllegionaminic acid synthase|uniref:acylneuraminate cytidylyltransferase family protein n=1 Tax=Brevibacillus borstelensis TaxID=45462 RepID=UPI002E23AE8E|nr:acylneuraminate cytidylyltransferase family protein [Brevibacillus borstelensis]MED2007469.1 acylneuraminate cytidylyltransferase family protein [Brevibacillus borstelensis]
MADFEAKAFSGIDSEIVKSKIMAIIPARGGSKGVYRKNIRHIAGKPLISYTIDAALACPLIDQCIVSTEDEEIKRISLEAGVKVINRPLELATDTALSEDVVRHVLENCMAKGDLPKYFVLLQPTSPMRNEKHITDCIDFSMKVHSRCTVSVTEVEHHPYKTFYEENGILIPLKNRQSLSKPRQQLPSVVRQNGAIYFMETVAFLEQNSFFVDPVLPYYMDENSSIDIDSERDFLFCEMLMSRSSD